MYILLLLLYAEFNKYYINIIEIKNNMCYHLNLYFSLNDQNIKRKYICYAIKRK